MSQDFNYQFEKPINCLSEDKLNRKNFAISLAEGIKIWKHSESYIISLYGEWGSGKTSIKNMMIAHIEKKLKGEILYTNFNPWQWSGQNVVAQEFLNEICKLLGKKAKGGKKVARLIRKYSIYSKIANTFLLGIKRGLLWLIGIPIIGLNVFSSIINQLLPHSIIYIIDTFFILTLLIGLTDFGANLLEKAGNLLDYSDVDLEDIKKEISNALEKLGKPILIIIDDIDRLYNESEIRYLIQLIKSNLDFPNIVYLILCQKDVIEKSLKTTAIDGKEFLEKIISLSFDVPRPNQAKIDELFFDDLQDLINHDEHLAAQFDWHRWNKIYNSGLRNLLKNLRKVNRYMLSLNFHLRLFKGEKAYNINPVDLCILEAIRTFEYKAYDIISRSKYPLAQTFGSDKAYIKDSTKACIEEILEVTSDKYRDDIKNILEYLFPKVKEAYSNYGISDHQYIGWNKAMNVCHPDWFDSYFRMSLEQQTISQSELIYTIELLEHNDKFFNKLQEFKERGLMYEFLNKLNLNIERIEKKYTLHFIKALFNFCAECSISQREVIMATVIISNYLKKLDDSEYCGKILIQLLEDSKDVSLPLFLREKLIQNDGQRKSAIDDLLEESHRINYENNIFIRVQKYTNDILSNVDKYFNSKNLAYIFIQWEEMVGFDKIKEYFKRLISIPNGIFVLLKVFTTDYYHQHEDRIQEGVHIYIKEIKKYISLDELFDKLNAIDKQFLDKSKLTLLNLWLQALEEKVNERNIK